LGCSLCRLRFAPPRHYRRALPRVPQLAEWVTAGASQRSGDLAPFRRPLATVLPDPRSVFAKHGANLSMLKRMVQRVLYPAAAGIHLTDSFPISVCTSCRVSRRKIFKSEDEVSWGFCASKQQPYFGFHGHVVLRDEIVVFALTLANVDERLVVRNWFGQITGLLIGAKVSSSRTWTRSATTSPLITGYIVKRRMRSLYSRAERMMEMERRCFSPCPAPWARTCRTEVRSQGGGIRQPAMKSPYRSLRKPAFR
jgi:hypothetical protein